MLINKKVIISDPIWLLLFLIAYVVAAIVFHKTEGNIIATATSFAGCQLTAVTIFYYAHGLL